jgi:transposase
MRGRSLQIAWQAADTEEALKAAYRAEADGPVRNRLHGLWLLRSGWSLRLVAELLGTHYRSVQRWGAWYRQGGLPAVRTHRMGGVGQPSFLTAEAQAEVAAVVAKTAKVASQGQFELYKTHQFFDSTHYNPQWLV